MAVLLTGGTGKTSTRIGSMLQNANLPFLLTSRKGQQGAPSGMQAVKFDWLDESTYENPFEHGFANGAKITAIYIVAPLVEAPSPYIKAFVDVAVKHGVNRFVMLTGSSAEKGGTGVGEAWQYLSDIDVEYTVLLATWFMENLSEAQYVGSIKNEDKIYTACGDGKIPFIGAKDIAATAFHALTDKEPHEESLRILGPELLTYDQVAERMSKALDRQITHVKLTQEEITQKYMDFGLPKDTAYFLGHIENLTSLGMEERSNDAVEKATGKRPQSLDAWLQDNKAAWQ